MAGCITILGITIPVCLVARWIASPSVQSEIGRWFEKRTNALSEWWSERHRSLLRHGGEDENETRKVNKMDNTVETVVEMPEMGDGMFTTMLCIIGFVPLFGPIIGLIYGIVNVKHRLRMKKARILIIVSIATFIGQVLTATPVAVE